MLRSPHQVAMTMGNSVDDTYTGVFDITVTLDFYVTGPGAPQASTPDQVAPLADSHRDGADLAGTLTVPRNTRRLVGEVYATGSGGG